MMVPHPPRQRNEVNAVHDPLSDRSWHPDSALTDELIAEKWAEIGPAIDHLQGTRH